MVSESFTVSDETWKIFLRWLFFTHAEGITIMRKIRVECFNPKNTSNLNDDPGSNFGKQTNGSPHAVSRPYIIPKFGVNLSRLQIGLRTAGQSVFRLMMDCGPKNAAMREGVQDAK